MTSIFPSEKTEYTDASTGARVTQWTRGTHKNQGLYFTSPSVTADDRWLVILSERTGHPNLFSIDRATGALRQLSRNENGLLHSYVYPQGGARGLSKASPCLDATHNRIFYIQDDVVYAIKLDDDTGIVRRVSELPANWYGAFTHISPDGKTLCVPCTDPCAFADPAANQWEQMRQVTGRMDREGLVTRIYLIDVETGLARLAAEVPLWVTHVQFDPLGTGRILFNREGFDETGVRPPHNRIWCLEPDDTVRPLSPEPDGEWRSHENWAPDGQSIIYHGGRGKSSFLASRAWTGELLREVVLDGITFWHATGLLDGRRILVDRPDGFISVVDPSENGSRLVNICRHDSTVEEQDAHPHPLTTPSGRSFIFTSKQTGNCHVYETALPDPTPTTHVNISSSARSALGVR
jgi:oligogalacturonide lyase